MFKTIKTTRTVSKIVKSLGPIDFVLDRPPYCWGCRDLIASVSYTDIVQELGVFRKAGYTETAIREIYQDLRDIQTYRGSRSYARTELRLPKPVKITTEIKAQT